MVFNNFFSQDLEDGSLDSMQPEKIENIAYLCSLAKTKQGTKITETVNFSERSFV